MKYKAYDLPDELLYNKDSTWVRVEGNIATIGIIEPMAKSVDEFLFAKVQKSGQIRAGDTYVSLEALKWSGHLQSPVSGTIVECNAEIEDEPEQINEHPYESWIVKIKIDSQEEIDKLYHANQITEWLDSVLGAN